MSAVSRTTGWVAFMVLSLAHGAPLDEQRIYFPGENPDRETESRSYGLQPHFQQHQIQQPYQQPEQDAGQVLAWSQDGGGEAQQIPLEPSHQEQSSYSIGHDGKIHSALQYHAEPLEASQQYSGRETFPYGSQGSSSFHQSSTSQGAANSPHLQGMTYSSSAHNGIVHGGRKTTKHSWASQYSTSGTGQIHQEPHEDHEAHLEPTQLGHGVGSSSSVHRTSSQELSSILDRPAQESHVLHPSIQQAFDNVIRDYGSGEPSRHTVHKISHTKKTTVQNVGSEPSHIQSSASNDDINLSQLIEQLQMLEQSPRHVNITWCEEKIKEFLRALRRKQASGVFVNQQVQEETLHQILTHESVERTDSSGGVNEPLFTKVTVRPLGREDFIHHEQHASVKATNVKLSEVDLHPPQDTYSDQDKAEVITVIPPEKTDQLQVMSHHQEHIQEPPPFTSDNSNDLKDLELELPEYVPFEHSNAGAMESSEDHIKSETRPLAWPSAQESSHSEISTGHEINENFPVKTSEETVHQKDASREINNGQEHGFIQQQSSNHEVIVGHQTSNQETADYHHSHLQNGNSDEGTVQKSDETVAIPPNMENGIKVSHEYQESHHTVHGRPEAPQVEIGGSSHDVKTIHSVHEEQSLHSGESSQDAQVEGNPGHAHVSQDIHQIQSQETSHGYIQKLHTQQINYDTLIEELIQLESIPGHQAIDKCEEKIQEFLEILKYQQEQGFGRNQQELERLHKTLIEQAQERSKQLGNAEETTLPPSSFWRRVQNKIKHSYERAKDRAKEVMG